MLRKVLTIPLLMLTVDLNFNIKQVTFFPMLIIYSSHEPHEFILVGTMIYLVCGKCLESLCLAYLANLRILKSTKKHERQSERVTLVSIYNNIFRLYHN